ncbi:MAG: alpha/beta hydrolase domain-containing protein [Caulobacterales bacterium]
MATNANQPGASVAQSYVPPLPTHLTPPPTGKGVAFLAAKNLDDNYSEKEFLLSGRANIYEYDAKGRIVIKAAAQPYTTRILVRYPSDAARYSGVTNVDFLHPEVGSESVWSFGRNYITRNNNAYVQITTSREARNPMVAGPPLTAVSRIKAFDPERYAAIEFPDGGLSWDIMSQVGRLIRTDDALNPLRAYLPKQVIAGGWSGAGAVTLFYINDGFHERARMPDGSDIFDAYLVGEPSWYPRINSSEKPENDLPDIHPKQLVQPRGVPAISLYSMSVSGRGGGMGLGRLRPDSDAPNDRYRIYMVGGASHVGRLAIAGLPGMVDPRLKYPIGDFPLDHYFNLTLDHLARWARGEYTPPRAEPLALDAEGLMSFDEHRNPVGGVRSVALDVPIASNFPNSGSSSALAFSAKVPFSREKLEALYGDEAGYVTRVVARAKELVSEGWLLQEDADEIVADAKKFKFDQ